MNAKEELCKRGFKKEGFWKDTETKKFNSNLNEEIRNKRYFLYAYVIDDEVMYIGKCHRTVSSRMNDYALNKSKDYPTENVQGLRHAMKNNICVEIYIYIPDIKIDGKITVDGNEILIQDSFEDITKGILDGLERKYIRKFREIEECRWNTQA
jgi:hypothetical protein